MFWEILQFIFSSFWIFIGTVILVAFIGDAIADMVKALLSAQ